MGTDKKRLRIRITDAANSTAATREIGQIFFKLRTERGVGNGVDLTLKPVLSAPYRHAGVSCTQMAVIVSTEKDVQNNIAPRYGAKKAPHQPSARTVIPASFSNTAEASSARLFLSFSSSAEFSTASICAASKAALVPLFTPTVATGIPEGI